jgi:hypothetical protein
LVQQQEHRLADPGEDLQLGVDVGRGGRILGGVHEVEREVALVAYVAERALAAEEWAVDKASSDDFRDVARLRLAAVLMDEKAYDEALKLLEAKHGAAYESQYAALRGDLLVAKNPPAEARARSRSWLSTEG